MKIDSLILKTTARLLLPNLLLFSLFIFIRGHNEPGGGFIAGLVASAAYALYSIAFDAEQARHVLGIETRLLIGIGLALALLSGLFSMFGGQSFLVGLWIDLPLPSPFYKVGTPLLFDMGVFLAVVGVTLTFIFALEEVK